MTSAIHKEAFHQASAEEPFLMNCWLVRGRAGPRVDRRQTARAHDPGQAGGDLPGDSGRVVALDDRCCHRGARLSHGRREGDDPNIALSLNRSMIEGFMEDKAIIEQQQRTLEADAAFRMNAIVADAPLVHFRRTLARIIAEEREGLTAVAA